MPDSRHSVIKLQVQADKIRKETFDGKPHTVLPAVIAIAGVLNGAKLTADELGKYVASWDGRPIPLLHPQKQGEHVSANLPDVLELRVGTVFNAFMDGDALKAEFWIDDERMDRRGRTQLLSDMVEGKTVMEVSTAYFCDVIQNIGEFKGAKHEVEHRNLRPDHVALLPGEVGACSVADGCGVPRINKTRFTMNEALKVFMKALGLQTNCADGNAALAANVLALAEKLKANGKLTGKQFESLASMDEEQRGMVGAILGAMGEADKAAAKAAKAKEKAKSNEGEEEEEEEEEAYAKNSAGKPKVMSQKDIDALVDKRVAESVERREREGLVETIQANSANTFDEDELKSMSLSALQKYEKSLRPVDYSGQGGFASHQLGEQTKNAPLLINKGLLAPRKDAAKAN
jgi:hypothetical protein